MENVERFIVQPSVKLFGGITVKKETEFHTTNDNGSIEQTLKDLLLTTTIKKEYGDNYKTTENTTLTQEIPEGTILVWSEETGYIIPNYTMVKPSEAIETLKIINDIK